MKNKTIALVEIAIVLCSLFLVALPAVAAQERNIGIQEVSASEVTTASEDDYVLGIYGNANEDDTIDMGDVVYTKLAIFGKKPKTELCDAKYDGQINVLDVIQTKLIILGKEKELTVVDSRDRIVTVNKPVKRIVAASPRCSLTMLRSIGVEENLIVGVESLIQSSGGKYGVNHKIFFPEFQDKPTVGISRTPDIEAILKLHPDVVFLSAAALPTRDKISDDLESAGIAVIRVYTGVYGRGVPEEVIKLGYIFDKRKGADEYIDWYECTMNTIKERVEKLPEDDKPKVYFETGSAYRTGGEYTTNIEFGGGKPIFPEITKSAEVDPEGVVEGNPDVIVKVAPRAPGVQVTGYDLDVNNIAGIKAVRDEIMSRPELQKTKAVKNGRVYVISGYILGYGPADQGAGFLHKLYIAKWLQLDLFGDFEPKAIHQEWLTRFQGLDIDLDKKGVFVYPPLE